MRKILKYGMLLSGPALLSGCSTNTVVTAENLCKDWRHMTVSKNDKITDKTASQIEASNESRVTWGCKLGANKAKS